MAVDKLVDSGKLDACCEAEAAAIIAKGGGTAPLAYDFANNKGFADAIAAIPSGGTEITDGIVINSRNSDGYALSFDYWLDSNNNIPPRTLGSGTEGSGWVLKNATTAKIHGKPRSIGRAALGLLASLNDLEIDTSEVTEIQQSAFWKTAALTRAFVFPKCTSVGYSIFSSSAVSSLKFPMLTSTPTAAGAFCFSNNKNLLELEMGSIGHAVTNIGTDIFSGDTQSTLTITMYTVGTNADTLLTRIRNGATNATIIIKASEDTTYGGTSYTAGDTMITSEVA